MYFRDQLSMDAELKRIAAEEAKLRDLSRTPDPIYRNAYLRLLDQLLKHKAEIVAKIGKK